MLARQVVVGGELATATGHGGGRTARSARGEMAYRAILASNMGTVRLWQHDGATAVVNAQRGRAGCGQRRRRLGGGLLRLLRRRREEQEMQMERWSSRASACLS